METTQILSTIAQDVHAGLSSKEKYLSSKYFYDTEGSKIFQQIMRMPEYYLTNSEYEIFQLHKKDIGNLFCGNNCLFDLIELGAGDGLKTKILLRHFAEKGVDFKYVPIDISADAVNKLCSGLKKHFPKLEVDEKIGDYFEMMEDLNRYDHAPKVLLFLGSNIGNFNEEAAVDFLTRLSGIMSYSDQLFVGFDLKKDPNVIKLAYDDPQGYTKAFNMNLLKRINRELGGNFKLNDFEHYPTYDPVTGKARSFIISKVKQSVTLTETDSTYNFQKWEPVYVEMSQKYDLQMIEQLAKESGLQVVKHFFDTNQYYVNTLFKKANKR